jgi:hypothetical protein
VLSFRYFTIVTKWTKNHWEGWRYPTYPELLKNNWPAKGTVVPGPQKQYSAILIRKLLSPYAAKVLVNKTNNLFCSLEPSKTHITVLAWHMLSQEELSLQQVYRLILPQDRAGSHTSRRNSIERDNMQLFLTISWWSTALGTGGKHVIIEKDCTL